MTKINLPLLIINYLADRRILARHVKKPYVDGTQHPIKIHVVYDVP